MAKTRRHHYLPVCYQKNFTSPDGKIFKLDFRSPDFFPRFSYAKNECYIEAYYEIPERFKVNYPDRFDYDPLFIETKVFERFENSYHSYVNKITRQRSLSYEEAKEFSRYLLQLKVRNPYWEKESLKAFDENLESSKRILREIILRKERFKNFDRDLIELALDEQLNLFKNDQDTPFSLMLERLIQWHQDGAKSKKFVDKMVKSKWLLYINEDEEYPFITTDNPGYSLHENGKCSNTRFADGYRYFFPISPKYCLCLTDMEIEKIKKVKMIHARKSTKTEVRAINQESLRHFNRIAISNSREYLSQIKKPIT